MNILYADDRPVYVEYEPGVIIPDMKATSHRGHNCRNCGAPLNRFGNCEYCGTACQMHSEIVMTADSIRITHG